MQRARRAKKALVAKSLQEYKGNAGPLEGRLLGLQFDAPAMRSRVQVPRVPACAGGCPGLMVFGFGVLALGLRVLLDVGCRVQSCSVVLRVLAARLVCLGVLWLKLSNVLAIQSLRGPQAQELKTPLARSIG